MTISFFRRENKVQHDGRNTARSNAGRQQVFHPIWRKLQDQRLLGHAQTDRQRQRDNHDRATVQRLAGDDAHAGGRDGPEHHQRRAAEHRLRNVLHEAAHRREQAEDD